MGKKAKVIYDRRSNTDRRTNEDNSFPLRDNNNQIVDEDRRTFGDRRRTEGLEIANSDLSDDEFDEVFKQFQKPEETENKDKSLENVENLEIYNYQVLYREGVECAYITILQTDEHAETEPTLYAFREEELNADSENESKPTHVQNIFGDQAYDAYLEQGWKDISKSENMFPWAIKAWLAMNMKQDMIKSR